MTRDRDLLALLREVDERLAAATPPPLRKARALARLRGARPSLVGRGGRPLVLAVAAGAAAVVFGATVQRPAPPEVSTRSPADPAVGITGDRPDGDGGLPERTPADNHEAAPPRIHAPLLRGPSRPIAPSPRTSPPPPHSSAAPPDLREAPSGRRRSELPVDRVPPPPPRARTQPPAVALPSSRGWVDAPERGLPPHASRGQPPSWHRSSGGAAAPAEAAGQDGEHGDESSAAGPDESAATEPKPPHEETSCRTAEALWREAEASCGAQGLALGEVRLLDPCGAGGYGRIEHTCAHGEPTACWRGELGDGLACVHGVELKDQAYITCRNQGADLAMFDYERDSPGCTGVTTARAFYECCPAAEPLPSPACWTSKIDHGDACQPLLTLDEEASALCAETGQQLFHIGYGTGVPLCPETWVTSALFTCCP
ncbi:hypothetical protein [Sorangium sp. So ce394]|uniref:hypothetical protein n=1 Tax=Sorangium sp. So ce394 TaxID=3133310 RepID=UPI003F5C178A